MSFKENYTYRWQAIRHEAENGDMESLTDILQSFVSGNFENNNEALEFVTNAIKKMLAGDSPNDAFGWSEDNIPLDKEWIVDTYLLYEQMAKENKITNPKKYALEKAMADSGLSKNEVISVISHYKDKYEARNKFIDNLKNQVKTSL